jgi:hypothetical protein
VLSYVIVIPSDEKFVTTLQFLWQYSHFVDYRHSNKLISFSAVHEKIFMVFMFGSLSYMLATIKVFKLVKPNMSDAERNSYLIKKGLFATSIVSTVGLCVFFLKHRLLCHDMGKYVLFRL